MTNDIESILAGKSGIQLDIGCGGAKQEGFVGMDVRPLPGVDIVWDVNEFPWPLPDDCVVQAIASHLVEHINPAGGGFIDFMNEVWRVMQVDGKFAIATPHGRSDGFLQDPTHCNPCSEATWAYFDPKEKFTNGMLYNIYKPKPWRIDYLTWSPEANIEVILYKRPDG
jgi:predicted SAM-dependent methyltransferase